jgi:hypothetical protein
MPRPYNDFGLGFRSGDGIAEADARKRLPHCRYCSCVLYEFGNFGRRSDDIVDCGMRDRMVVE